MRGRARTCLGDRAARLSGRIPQWLRRVPRVETPLAKTAALEVDGHRVWLAVARGAPRASGSRAAAFGDLPPSLAAVARLLAAGLSDKEIASELDLRLATVRTYTTRIYRRLDVSGRRELILWSLVADSTE